MFLGENAGIGNVFAVDIESLIEIWIEFLWTFDFFLVVHMILAVEFNINSSLIGKEQFIEFGIDEVASDIFKSSN